MGKAVRLDKFLADAGAGTRSEVKKYIQKGQVQINGETVKRPETKVTVSEDTVTLQGEIIGAVPELEYYLLHKPAGYISATEDSKEPTVMELVPSKRKGLFPVGRLDKDTEGLLLITNDGMLAHELLSPKKHVDKTYYVIVDGKVTEQDILLMEKGVDIGEEKPTLPSRLEILSVSPVNPLDNEVITSSDSISSGSIQWSNIRSGWRSEIRLTIHEGKFHQVKRMMEAVGKKVLYLKRLSMGPLTLPENLPKGQCRPLTEDELTSIKLTKKYQ